MADRGKEPAERTDPADHLLMMTVAAATVLVIVVVGAVIAFGTSEAGRRIGCGLNGWVNGLMAYPRPC